MAGILFMMSQEWVRHRHQQLDKRSEGLKKTEKIWKDLRKSEKIWQTEKNWYQKFSESFRSPVGQTLRNGDFWYQTIRQSVILRQSDSQMSDYQTVSYCRNIRQSDCQTARQSVIYYYYYLILGLWSSGRSPMVDLTCVEYHVCK